MTSRRLFLCNISSNVENEKIKCQIILQITTRFTEERNFND